MTNLRRPVRLQNVFLTFRKPNNTLNGHVLITCERRFQNVRKTFYRRTGRLWFVCPFEVLLQCSKRLEDVMKTYWTSPICNAFGVTDTSSRRFRWKRLSHVIRTCPFEVLFQFSKRLEGVMKTCWTRLQHVLGGNVFHTSSERVRLRCCFSFPNV